MRCEMVNLTFVVNRAVQRSSGGGAPLATDVANGRLQCGCDTIAYCKVRTITVFGS